MNVANTLDEFRGMPFPRILLINYEQLPKIIERVRKVLQWHVIVFDEAQRLRARNGLSSRTAAKLRHSGLFKLALSGTPEDKEPQEMWGIMRFINEDALGDWKSFEAEHMDPIDPSLTLEGLKPNSFKWKKMLRTIGIAKHRRKFNVDTLELFQDKIRPWVIRVDKDVLDLPPKRFHYERVMLLGNQRRLYDDLLAKSTTQMMDLDAPLKVTQLVKLQQITGGYVIDNNGDSYCVGHAKMRRLVQLHKRFQNEPVAIFAKYRAEIGGILRELIATGEMSVAAITGETDKATRMRLVERFQEGRLNRLIIQIKTGGVGIDLFRACKGIVYSSGVSFIDFDQMIARLHRRGQTQPVDFYLLTAAETIDLDVYRSLKDKTRMNVRVLQPLKRNSR